MNNEEIGNWKRFAFSLYPRGLSRVNAQRVREIHEEAANRVRRTQREIQDLYTKRAGINILHQERLAAQHRDLLLMQETERFVRERPPALIPEGTSNLRLLAELFSRLERSADSLSVVYGDVSYDEGTLSSHSTFREARERIFSKFATLYDRTLKNQKDAHRLYTNLKAEAKSETPYPLHRFIDLVVDLFVYDRYEALVLYLRRHHPGPIGAFHGLPESVGFKRPLK